MSKALFGLFLCVAIVSSFANFSKVDAEALSYVSDLIANSAPSTNTAHTIQFTVANAVPPSGKILIAPSSGDFTIPIGFDYTDVDLSISSGGPYAQRDVAATASATDDGVAVTSGAFGSIVITLNSTTGIAAGEKVRIVLGTAAVYGTLGTVSIVNPSALGSYRIEISTRNNLDGLIDGQSAMIAVVAPVNLTAGAPVVAPLRSNGLPSGLLSAGNRTIELSLDTNMYASCRYATSSGVVYDSMTGIFSPTLGTSHYAVVTGHQDNTSYIYYIRCKSQSGITNSDDFLISFSLKPPQASDSSIVGAGDLSNNGLTGNLGNGGAGDFPNGSSVLFLASVTISGWSIPLSTIQVLTDGKKGPTAIAKNDGSFSVQVNALERGTYTFQTYAQDSKARRSSSDTATLSLTSGSRNEITNVVIPPTIALSQEAIGVGDPVSVLGESIPSSPIEVTVQLQSRSPKSPETHVFTATTSSSGAWELPLDTSHLQKGTFTLRARAIYSEQAKSEGSELVFLSIGTSTSSNLGNRADINKDGRVNLIDFSILLSHWAGDDADSDINQDGAINLSDFSILLFNWTG